MHSIIIPEELGAYSSLRINHWFYEEGDEVLANTDLFEIVTEAGVVEIQAQVNGVLDEIYYSVNDEVEVGDFVGQISFDMVSEENTL